MRARAAGRVRAAVGQPRPPRRPRPLPHLGRHRAGRVLGARRQQRLHEPDGAVEPARGVRGGATATPTVPRRSGSAGRAARVAARRARDVRPLRRAPRHPPAGRGLHPPRAWPFDETPRDHYPLLLHYPYFELYRKQVVKQADLVLALHCAATRSTPSTSAQLRLLRADHRARLVAVGVHAGGHGGRGRPPRARARLPGEAALMDLDDLATTPATACTWPRWPAR